MGTNYSHIVKDPDLVSTAGLIDQFGWAVMNIHPSADDPEDTASFSYTINLPEFCGLPELIMFQQSNAQAFITYIVQKAETGWRYSGKPEQIPDIIDGYFVELRPVDSSHISEHFGTGQAFYRETRKQTSFNAAQVFWPDFDGLFPWDKNENTWFQPRLDLPKHTDIRKFDA